MKNITKILILSILTIFMISGFSSKAFAVDTLPLQVLFNQTPLFNVGNFMPGDYKDANITVTNNSDTTQNAYIEAINVSNSDNLASQMTLQISEGSTEIYNNNFKTFLNAGPVSLSNIVTSSSKTYNLKVTFLENTNNDYQGKTLGFDICVGLSGGNQTCTNTTTIGPENPNGGSGGSTGRQQLIILNENASNISANGIIPESGQATISWNTNIPATSQVVYGVASSAPYPFNINNPPNFGYTFVSNEDMVKKVNHEILLTGLTPGETYVYRVVSRASPATVSPEYQFIAIPPPATKENNLALINNSINNEQLLGIETQLPTIALNSKLNNINNTKTTTNNNLLGASVVNSDFNYLISIYSIYGLLLLLVMYLIWKLWLKENMNK